MTSFFTIEEVSRHNSESDCWIIIDNGVYDVTSFISQHPGGAKPILNLAGKDATKEFHLLHDAQKVLHQVAAPFRIGTLASSGSSSSPPPSSSSSSSSSPSSSSSSSSSSPAAPSLGDTLPYLNREKTLLDKELRTATFRISEMTHILDGGAERTEKRRWILKPLEKLALVGKHELQREQLLEAHFRDFIAIHKPFIENGYMPQREEVAWMSGHATNSGPLMPHMSLSLTTIIGQGSEEQIGWWLWRALTFQMVISYSQTELAHGSNVRGLQTTAHFDKSAGDFVLNTPTLESIKWWNSGLGLAATHALVFAQLIIGDANHGVHVFMVQVRDEYHNVLPGIELGDVGAKLGDNGIDTGYMVLKGVRVPREHLLSKRQHVTPDGTYVRTAAVSAEKTGASKLHYLTMMTARSGMISIAGSKLAIAALVATRYSCMREQGFKANSTHAENQIVDYQVQQYRLLKQISASYAIKFCGQWISLKIASIDITAADISEDVLDEIAALHVSSAGLKALSSILAADGIEDCRKCCGGHGFLLSSGVAALAADYVWQTTAEGDHVVLFIQAAKALVKEAPREAVAREFAAARERTAGRFRAVAEWFDLELLEDLFYAQRLNSLLHVLDLADGAGAEASEILLVQLTKAHCFWFLLSKFRESIGTPLVQAQPECLAVLRRLCAFWACAQVFDASSVLWSGILDHAQILLLSRAVHQLLRQLRPDVLALVESFDIPEHVHQSTIGRADGKVYQALYKNAKDSRLNKLPIESWYQHLRPNLDLEYLQSRSRL